MRGREVLGSRWSRAAGAAAIAAILLVAFLAQFRITEREWVEDRTIPPPIRERKTWLAEKGWSIILREGIPGVERVRVRECRRGWRTLRREETAGEVLRAPRREVRLVGASDRKNPVNAYKLSKVVRSYRMLATGYGPGPGSNSWKYAGVTKLGWRTRRGIVAVDPKVIPLRTLLYIEGYGFAWAGDVGSAIKGERIDLCFNRTQEALKWGKRHAYVYVLKGVRTEE